MEKYLKEWKKFLQEGKKKSEESDEGASKFKGSHFGDDDGNSFSVEEIYDFVEKNKKKYLKKDFPISKIEDQLEWWDKLYSLDNPDHKKRMMAAKTSYPLLVIKEKEGNLSVADGLNRLYKAVNIEEKKKIDVYLINKKDIMKFAK